MTTSSSHFLVYPMLLATLAGCTTHQASVDSRLAPESTHGVLPLVLVPNAGQWPGHVLHAAPGGGQLWLERDAIALARPIGDGRVQLLRLRVLDANAESLPVGEHTVAGTRNFFMGNAPREWRTGLPAYDVVRWKSIRPGVDLVLNTQAGVPEYVLDVASPDALQGLTIACEGADDLVVQGDGSLRIVATAGDLVQSPPLAWSRAADGAERPIPVRFRRLDGSRFAFEAPHAPVATALCIDPMLQWSTFVGGSSTEWGYDTWREPDGTVLVVGETTSTNFPTTPGVFDPTYNGFGPPSNDVFVARISSTGTGVVYATYLGGAASDRATGVHGDGSGGATVTGATSSANFPTTPGAWDTTLGGSSDAFVSRLNPSGTALVFSTFLGGAGDDMAEDLDVEINGDVWVTGVTSSASFPTTAGAFSSTRSGTSDAYVAKLSSDGSQLLASTLIGGNSGDVAKSVAVGGGGEVLVGGVTSSPDFPTTPGCFQSSLSGTSDAWLARFDAQCQHLLGSTLLGGSSGDVGEAVTVAPNGLLLIGGTTSSSNFPVTPGAFQSTAAGSSDGFVAAFDNQMQRRWATLIGGNSGDVVKSISVTPFGTVMAGGQCSSSSFPITPGAVLSSGLGSADAFVVHLASDGRGILAGTLLGGSGSDGGEAIDGRNEAAVSITGVTNSGSFPVSPGAWSPSLRGSNDAFATLLDMRTPGVVRYGVSTPACRGAIHAGVGRWPAAGAANFALTCTQAPPNTVGVVVIGFAPAPGYPVLGITAWVDILQPTILETAWSDADGSTRIPVSLASVSSGGRFYAQFAWINPPGCGVAFDLSASDAVEVTIQ
jgi:hypothetical protein